jgi:hypothetical protein
MAKHVSGTSDGQAPLLGCHTTFAIVYLSAARLGRSGMSSSESPPSSSVRAGGGGDLGRDLRPLKDPLDDVAAKSKSFPGECSSDCGDLSRALPPPSESPLCWAGTSWSLFTNTLLGVTNKGKDHGAYVSTRDARAASIPSVVESGRPFRLHQDPQRGGDAVSRRRNFHMCILVGGSGMAGALKSHPAPEINGGKGRECEGLDLATASYP